MRHLQAVPQTAPRAVLYLRQSVARDDSISIELQEIAGRDYCAAHGYTVVGVEVDEGISGRTWSKRPAVQRTMDLIERRDADVIVLWKWSRLSRSRKDWALAADRVEVAGGRIESATEPIDTATASGRFARGVMTEYAAFQSEQIGEQWSEVFARRFSMGLPVNGAVPWGWTAHKDRIEFDQSKLHFLERAYEMYFEGAGWREIARWLSRSGAPTSRGADWSAPTARSLLSSPVHAGFIEYKGVVREGAHEGVISRETWERFQVLRDSRTIPRRPRRSPYLLSSLVVCHCGRKRSGRRRTLRSGKGSHDLTYYKCDSISDDHGPKAQHTEVIDAAVGRWIAGLPATPNAAVSENDSASAESLAREVTGVEKQLVKLTEHLLTGLVPEIIYAQTQERLSRRRDELTFELERETRARSVSSVAFLNGKEELIATWDLLAIEDKQALARSLIEKVVIQRDGSVHLFTLWGDSAVIEV